MNKTIYAILILTGVSLAGATHAVAQSADDLLSEGRDAYLDYRFDDAERLYANAKKKAKKSDEFFADKYDKYRRELAQANNFLERVEKIVIIDSISVPRNEFFKHYRLPASAGSLGDRMALPRRFADNAEYVFTNEGEDYKLWSEPDSTGNFHLVESTLLTDGSWSDPTPLSDELSEGRDAIYPFMMADGVTLYYAENGENSIGGFDIMVATRDAADGSFLQPSNLGFPYNSPYDDYMLAIDELNGVGWWATDRNQLDDEITIYVFVTNDLRNNYSPDEDDVVGFARISDYMATQPEGSDYSELLTTIRSIDPEEKIRKPEFTFAASKGRILHFYDELPSGARDKMRNYLTAEKELEKAEGLLREKRMNYHRSNSSSLGVQIRSEEQKLETKRQELRKMRSLLYKEINK